MSGDVVIVLIWLCVIAFFAVAAAVCDAIERVLFGIGGRSDKDD
jgi:hypothetical protein